MIMSCDWMWNGLSWCRPCCRRYWSRCVCAPTLSSCAGWRVTRPAFILGELDKLILQQKEDFYFRERVKRPPTDNINAMLSFIYTILANDCASALETVGLDAYAGFLHRDRPGRASLALDLIEELRGPMADRFVMGLVNKRQVNARGFEQRENGSVIMTDETRKEILKAWQERKREPVTHPYLKEKIEWGLIPHVQSMLLARLPERRPRRIPSVSVEVRHKACWF